MSRPKVPKISLKAVERKRAELNSQRTLLHRTLRDAPSIEDALDVIRALNAALYPPRKEADWGRELRIFIEKCTDFGGEAPHEFRAVDGARSALLSASISLGFREGNRRAAPLIGSYRSDHDGAAGIVSSEQITNTLAPDDRAMGDGGCAIVGVAGDGPWRPTNACRRRPKC